MQIGYIPGVWDLLHVGHVAILTRAHSLCDRLVVGVPSDEVVYEDKKKYPTIKLDARIKMLESLRCVDVVLPYFEFEFITHLTLVHPDLLIVGSTWGKECRHIDAENWCRENNCRLVKLPYTRGISSTAIKKELGDERATST